MIVPSKSLPLCLEEMPLIKDTQANPEPNISNPLINPQSENGLTDTANFMAAPAIINRRITANVIDFQPIVPRCNLSADNAPPFWSVSQLL